MIRLIAASQAKNNFGAVIKRVYEKDELQVVERDGVPVVAIVRLEDLERLYPERVLRLPKLVASRKRQQAVQRLLRFLDQVLAVEADAVTIEADIQQAVDEVRHGTHQAG